MNKAVHILVVVETAVLGLAAMGVFGFLVDVYEQTSTAIVEQTVTAAETEMSVALLSATPPAPVSTSTPSPSQTPLLTGTPTVSPSPTLSPTGSRSPARTPAISPVLAGMRTPTASGARTNAPPPPTRPPWSGSWIAVNRCQVIDDAGNYRLGTDLVANGDCIIVHTSYAVLDCGGHSIRGTGFAGSGIALGKYGPSNSSPAYVEIRNCRISNFRYGMFVESGHHLAIHDNDSSYNYDDVDPSSRYGNFLGSADGGGIRVNYAWDSSITANTTLHQAIGIDVRYSNAVTIRNNTSSQNSAWGINLYATNNSEVSGNATADNVRRCTWGAGEVGLGCDAGGIVLQAGANGNTVSNNRVTGENGNGIFIKAHSMPCGSNNSIIGNTITSVLYNAIELGFCSGNKVNNNTIRDGLDGIWLGFSHDTEIKNNSITNMRNHGIISSNSRNNVVSGNMIVNSNDGLYFYSENYDQNTFSWLTPGDYRSHDNCLCGNSFQNNLTTAIRLKDSTRNQVINNQYQGNGRTVIVMGNNDGNNIQSNVSWQLSSQLSRLLALP